MRLRRCLLLVSAFNFSLLDIAPAQNNDAPVPTARIPATVDVLTFGIHNDGEDHKLVVIPTPELLRVDAPRDALTVIYDPKTQHYTGLENRNYTYWEFSWPAVRTAVESSKRYETRLHDVGADTLDEPPPLTSDNAFPTIDSTVPSPPLTNTPGATTPPDSDDSGYIWQPTASKKRIAGLDCVLWTGTSVAGDPVQAWCYAGLEPRVQNALAQLRAINEPMALVPVRDLVPSFVFVVTKALAKGGNTPLLVTWGDNSEKSKFELLSIKSREGKIALFSVPRIYVKTTLVTMDGIGDQKVPEASPETEPFKHGKH